MSSNEITDLFFNLLTLASLGFVLYFLYVDLIKGRRK